MGEVKPMTDEMETTDPKSGAFILSQLERSGSDLDRKHEVTFWLYFPCEESARHAANRAGEAGLKPEVSPPLKNHTQWLCLLYYPHVPDEGLLDAVSEFCTDLAVQYNGEYDGWESRLELPEGASPEFPPGPAADS